MKKSSSILANVNHTREIWLTIAGLTFTAVATIFLMQDLGNILQEKVIAGHVISATEQAVFFTIVIMLIYGNIVYQISRLGFLIRDKKAKGQNDADDLQFFREEAPALTILVPSYKEETKVIHQTLLSAAIQQYPNKRVVLLIDDPPNPKTDADAASLKAAENLPQTVTAFLERPRIKFTAERKAFLNRLAGDYDLNEEALHLAGLYEEASSFFAHYAAHYEVSDHTDKLFVSKILAEPIEDHKSFARRLRNQVSAGSNPDRKNLVAHYNRLIGQFTVDISFFERKRYENLSHEVNKAMNLNTYIGMIGKSFRESRWNGKLLLKESTKTTATLSIPDAKYLITLDADSLILSSYALRLASVMEEKGNERLAVVQTPYSAIPGTDNMMERVAGATTDIQLLIHQGFTWANATFWVGANALIRREALEDIKDEIEERGYAVPRYIQDRTVIEDTESSIDLVDKGWRLHNYPARMAYSATPPDYGSLLIQRRRWANGGLIIAPKLLRYLFRKPSPRKLAEGFVRLHYLVSIAATSIGVLMLILYPFEDVMRTWWLPLSALPYFYLYGRDLKLSGYNWADLPRVYALNLMLIPINLGGVFKSIQQGVTKAKIPFVRTPKIGNRTAAPALYVACEFLILAYCFGAFAVDLTAERWMHATFSLVNGLFFAYACTYLMGWKAGYQDLAIALRTPEQVSPAAEPKLQQITLWTNVCDGLKATNSNANRLLATSMKQTVRFIPSKLKPAKQDNNRDAA